MATGGTTVEQMKFRGIEINKFVDMVGYIKNQPLDVFRIKHADERRYSCISVKAPV
jgi:DNA-binding protein